MVVFLAGACGDVTQVDNLSPYRRPGAGAVGPVRRRPRRGRGGQGAADASSRERWRRWTGRIKVLEHQAPHAQPRAGQAVLRAGQEGPQGGRRAPSGPLPRRSCCWTRRLAKEPVGRGGSAGDPGRAGRVRHRPGRVLLPVRAGHQGRKPVPASPSPCSWPTAAWATCRPRRPWASTAAATRRG